MDPLLFMIIINVNDALVRKMLAQQWTAVSFSKSWGEGKKDKFSKWSSKSYKHKDYNF